VLTSTLLQPLFPVAINTRKEHNVSPGHILSPNIAQSIHRYSACTFVCDKFCGRDQLPDYCSLSRFTCEIQCVVFCNEQPSWSNACVTQHCKGSLSLHEANANPQHDEVQSGLYSMFFAWRSDWCVLEKSFWLLLHDWLTSLYFLSP
jgi:hypothetical protein